MELATVLPPMITDSITYERVTKHAGFYDASGTFGRVFARGADTIDLLHRMSTNDLKPLEKTTGRSALTVLTNEKARFIDVLKVVRDPGGSTILITSGGKEQAVIDWLNKYVIMEDAAFTVATDQIRQFLLCGPSSDDVLSQFSSAPLSPDRNAVYDIQIDGLPATLVRGPSLASNGWFVLTGAQTADEIGNRLGADVLAFGGALIAPELFDLLRIENGTPIAPNEINDKHNPLETGLGTEAVSFTKGCYIGQEVIARLDAQSKVQRQLMKLEIMMPWADAESELINSPLPLKIMSSEGAEIGEFTSWSVSPITQRVVGLAYIRSAQAIPEHTVGIAVHENILMPATLRAI